MDIPVVIFFGSLEYKMRASCVDIFEWELNKALISLYKNDPYYDYSIANDIEKRFKGVFPSRIVFDIVADLDLFKEDFIGFNL